LGAVVREQQAQGAQEQTLHLEVLLQQLGVVLAVLFLPQILVGMVAQEVVVLLGF